MIHQVVTRVSLESFRERASDKKIVLLYPWTNYRNLFLGHFLASSEEGLLYYRVPQDVVALDEWLADIAEEFNTVLGGFGDHIRGTLDGGDAHALGEAFAADLNSYGGDQVTLFIDEFDRVAPGPDLTAFIDAMVDGLNDNRQIAFSSRLLTYQPWYDKVASGVAVVLGTEYRKNDVMFTLEAEIKPQLEIYGFGRGHALVNGHEITNWDGALPRNLFFYFIDNPLVTRDDIFETFWPNLSVKEATNVFHVTKRKISERITMKVPEEGNFELTQYTSGFYMPSDKIVRHYDVIDFQEAVERATTSLDPREEESLYRRAIDLYKAPYLETVNMPWVDERRDHMQQLYTQALVGLGRICRDRGDREEALGYFSRTLKEAPEREDIHREVMRLYIHMGMPDDARRQYHYLEHTLNDMYKIKPAQETRDLFESLSA